MQIDKEKTYLLGDYKYKNFTQLTEEEILNVWKWRNDDAIRKYMYNPDIIPLENHRKFIQNIGSKEEYVYWLVFKGSKAAGVVNLTSIDATESKAEIGYYLVPEMMDSGIGLDFAYHNIYFAFCEIGCHSLFGGIDKRNNNALVLDSYLGCVLNKDDIAGLKDIQYIRWTLNSSDFLRAGSAINDFRKLVRYMRDNKGFFNEIKENAGEF